MEIMAIQKSLMALLFVVGYFFITIEHFTKINKATCALFMAVFSWLLQFGSGEKGGAYEALCHHLSTVSEVILFLLGALTIVETINTYGGFRFLHRCMKMTSQKRVLWTMGILTFFLSAILDNLTTTIVMVTVLVKLIHKCEERFIIGSAIVISANAGGAWTPIGDVTTTMLWVGGQISSFEIMKTAFLPSLLSMVVSLAILSQYLKGKFEIVEEEEAPVNPFGTAILCLGIVCLIMVPVIKVVFGLPPYMSMLLGLAVMWLVTDLLSAKREGKDFVRMPQVLSKIDLSGVFFFLGILLAVAALEASFLLSDLAQLIDQWTSNSYLISVVIGFASAIVDNVPLVAVAMSMYSLEAFPVDAPFWQLTAYTAGTGGSLLIIGSTAGIAYMGMEKVDFFWYCKKISFAALVGYLAGAALLIYQSP